MPTPFLFHPLSAVYREHDAYHVVLYTRQDETVRRVWLRVAPDNEERLYELSAQPSKRDPQWSAWRANVPLSPHADHTLYCFQVACDDAQYWCHGAGISPYLPLKTFWFRHHHLQQPPDWVYQQVFYQIYPERFANGQPELTPTEQSYRYNPAGRAISQRRWGAPVPNYGRGGSTTFYGGDLPGIEMKLDYLSDLGVTGLYLNPIFASPSNHKYDTADYYQVDPHFGGNQALVSLRNALDQRQMRLLLDAVLNHTSEQHPWFDRFGGNGAAHNPDSPYRDWYSFNNEGYAWNWNGIPNLHKLNFAHPQVQATFYRSDNAVLKHWLKPPYRIDGWRFDVIHMLGEGTSARNNAHYVHDFRQAMRSVNPDAYVLGEHMQEATDWLQGELEDGAMNYYGFTFPVRDFLTGSEDMEGAHPIAMDAAAFATLLQQRRGVIPFANQLAQYNLLNSHDTARMLTLLGEQRPLAMIAATLLLSYVGVPSIYYGDEVGLAGGPDPDCRRCFPWDQQDWDQQLFAHYRRLIALRKQRSEWQYGDLITLYAADDVWVFARWYQGAHSLVAINRGAACELQLDLTQLGRPAASYREQFSGDALKAMQMQLKLHLPSCSSAVYLPEDDVG